MRDDEIAARCAEGAASLVNVVAVRADDTVTGQSVLAHFDGRLARFKRPKDVVFVAALPRNALGKVVAEDVRALLPSSS